MKEMMTMNKHTIKKLYSISGCQGVCDVIKDMNKIDVQCYSYIINFSEKAKK